MSRPSSIEGLDVEIALLHGEIRTVERAPPSFDEAWPDVERVLVVPKRSFAEPAHSLAALPQRTPRRFTGGIRR
jgi:hypothetical protein